MESRTNSRTSADTVLITTATPATPLFRKLRGVATPATPPLDPPVNEESTRELVGCGGNEDVKMDEWSHQGGEK